MIGNKKEKDNMNLANPPGDIKAILGRGSEFDGKLRFEGTVRIDGKFKGEIHSDGTLIVGEHAMLEGEVNVDSVIIAGEFRGNVRAKSRLELHAPAKMFGDLVTPILIIQEGVVFEGHCQMTKEKDARAGAPIKIAAPPKPVPEPISAH